MSSLPGRAVLSGGPPSGPPLGLAVGWAARRADLEGEVGGELRRLEAALEALDPAPDPAEVAAAWDATEAAAVRFARGLPAAAGAGRALAAWQGLIGAPAFAELAPRLLDLLARAGEDGLERVARLRAGGGGEG